MERNYEFRQRMLQVHTPDLRDDSLWVSIDGTAIDNSWEILYPAGCDRVLRNAALDLQDFFDISMKLYPHLQAVPDINACLNREKAIILTDAALTPELAPDYTEAGAYHLEVKESSVIICGRTERGTAQGVYYIENRMGINRGPVLKQVAINRRPLFSPRMTHSGFGLDKFPDQHISAIAHNGMDAILVFVKDLHISPQGHLDFNDLIYRAAGYGVDVYAYSYLKSPKHPDDPDAWAFYETTYGKLFKACPGLKGVTLVGESVEFPSKDPRTSGCMRDERGPDEKRPSPGWFPCSDYPQWVSLVRDIIHQYNPTADVVLWSYNWGAREKEARVDLIRNLPLDISLNVTYEMFQTFKPAPGIDTRCVDYTLMFEGPGDYFVSEAEAAHERGLKLYSMANTGGLTWDIGVIPYQPCPYQWKRRYDGMVKAYYDWGLRGVMESHHYGFYPSFVSELANVAFWEPAVDYETAMREIAARDYGKDNVDLILDVWKDYSDGIRKYVSTNPDQYGPFRIGPSYPLLFQKKDRLPFPPYTYYGDHICQIEYDYYGQIRYGGDVTKRADLDFEMASNSEMADIYQRGNEKLETILPNLTGRQLDNAMRLLGIGRFTEKSARTTVNVKRWYIQKCRLLTIEESRHDLRGRIQNHEVKCWEPHAETPEEIMDAIDQMRQIAAEEIENARSTIPYVEYDSRLGYEPTMEYMTDREHLEWKIAMTERALTELEPIYEEAKKKLAK